MISLKSLQLNCDVINEFLVSLPFRAISIHIEELRSKICYDIILTEGCQFDAKNVTIVLNPFEPLFENSNPNVNNSEESKTNTNHNSNNKDNKNFQNIDNNSEYYKTLNILVEWVESIVSHLKLSIENLIILFKMNNSSEIIESRKYYIKTVFQQIEFFNTHPNAVSMNTRTNSNSNFSNESYNPNDSYTSFYKSDNRKVIFNFYY